MSEQVDLDMEITCACAADLMSDILASAKPGSVLLTGLCNPQVMRAVDMADIAAVVFVRDKRPQAETIALAEEKGLPLVVASHSMFEMCGRLHRAGLEACGLTARVSGGERPPQRPPGK